MRADPFVKILISLPESIKRFLDDLKRLEGVTASGYIRKELESDLEARLGSGWNPVTGWNALDDPAYQRHMRVAEKRAEKGLKRLVAEKKKAATAAGRRKGQ